MSRIGRFAPALMLALASACPAAERVAVEFEQAVTEQQRYCQSSRQCTTVYTRCDSCACPVAINVQFADGHQAALDVACGGYAGPHCDKVCTVGRPECVYGFCTLLP